MSPGDVEEDQALEGGQGHLLVVHLQLQVLVEAPALADPLQTDLHVHSFVVEPGRRPGGEGAGGEGAGLAPLPPTSQRHLLLNLSGSSSRAWWKSRLSSASIPRPK